MTDTKSKTKLTDLRGGTPLTTMPAGTVLQVVNGVTPTTATPATNK